MARPKRHAPRRRADALAKLTPQQQIELTVGAARGGRRSAFRSDEERRAAWELHRLRLRDEGTPPEWADRRYHDA